MISAGGYLPDCLGKGLSRGCRGPRRWPKHSQKRRLHQRQLQARLLVILAAATSAAQVTAEKPAAWETEEALLQQQHGKPLSSKKKQGAGKISKYEVKEEVESEIPQEADYDEAHVEGLKEGELLFRFGDLEGWELTAEPLGVISFGQACQVWRKNDLVAKQPSKAADVPFSFQLWDEEPDAGEDNWRADEDEDDVEWIADLDNELLADLADDLDENDYIVPPPRGRASTGLSAGQEVIQSVIDDLIMLGSSSRGATAVPPASDDEPATSNQDSSGITTTSAVPPRGAQKRAQTAAMELARAAKLVSSRLPAASIEAMEK
ncbi:hypothetical protein WJX84_008893, partial [Apatococcus fuscideae]